MKELEAICDEELGPQESHVFLLSLSLILSSPSTEKEPKLTWTAFKKLIKFRRFLMVHLSLNFDVSKHHSICYQVREV